MDLICFCHLRWNFVYQRPQHLLSRFTETHRVIVIEEPVFDASSAFLDITISSDNLWIVVPHLIPGIDEYEAISQQQSLLRTWAQNFGIDKYLAWFYTPMALPLVDALPVPELIIYDCMDELSAFKNAPASLKENETLLLAKADLVFTGGYSLYEAKKNLHTDIYPFPSSIDKNHFARARSIKTVPIEYDGMPHPRIGFFGVIDERFDIGLLGTMAALRPGWQFVLIGPVVKIDPACLPKAPNIYYLGSRSYEELPSYLAGWDVAIIPFAANESTRFISPTKTPEYLAGGIPVVSTSIRDVINPYGERELVFIADTPRDFITGIERALEIRADTDWLKKVDEHLEGMSWNITWQQMMNHIKNKLLAKQKAQVIKKENVYV